MLPSPSMLGLSMKARAHRVLECMLSLLGMPHLHWVVECMPEHEWYFLHVFFSHLLISTFSLNLHLSLSTFFSLIFYLFSFFYGWNIREQLLSPYIGIQQAFLSSLIKIGLKNMKIKFDTKIEFGTTKGIDHPITEKVRGLK